MKNSLPAESRACIKELKKLLAMAEQGRLRGLAYGITFTEDNNPNFSAWDVDAVGSYRTFPMDAVATVNILKLTVERWALDRTAPPM